MADFLQQNGPQDPDALRKAMLLKMFGALSASGQPAGVPPGSMMNPPAPVKMAPAAVAGPAKPTAQPLAAAANNNSGNMEPAAKPPILSEADWQKQNPAAPHKPYKEPDLKHRLLMGLFGGMQEFGRPGEGARTIGNYTGDIAAKTEAEKNWPITSEQQQHGRYEQYLQGQKGPLDLEDLRAQISERQANATAKLHPPMKTRPINIEDPADPTKPKIVDFDQATGAFIDPDTKQAIPGARPWQHQSTAPPKVEYDNGIPVGVSSGGKTFDIHDPNLPAELKPLVQSATAAHKQYLDEQAAREARAEKRGKEKEERQATRKEVSDHDRAYVKPAEDIEKSYQMMNGAYNEYKAAKAQGKELPTGAQSMLALSSHLQTTFGNVKGARVTKEMIQHHLGARSITDDMRVAFQKLQDGDVLSPQQWDAFHELIGNSRKLSWQTAVKEADRKKIPVDFLPQDLEGLSGEGEAKPAGGGNPQNPLEL
jgi:hypothetical protein